MLLLALFVGGATVCAGLPWARASVSSVTRLTYLP